MDEQTPIWCASNVAGPFAGELVACGHAKVGDLDGAVRTDKQVGALDVAVDDTLVVEVLEAKEHLLEVSAHQQLGEIAAFAKKRAQRAVFDVFHDNVHVRFGRNVLDVSHDVCWVSR